MQNLCDVKLWVFGGGWEGGGGRERKLSWLLAKFYPGMHLEGSKNNTAKLIQDVRSWWLFVKQTKYLIPCILCCYRNLSSFDRASVSYYF